MENITPIFIVAFIFLFLFIVFTKKGKGMMLGGKIVKTLNDEIKQREGIASTTIRVHVIERKNEPEHGVSIELNQNAKLAWSMTPIKLTRNEARKLIRMLKEALGE